MMISRQYQILLAVAKSGSTTRAAQELYITQPAVSNALANIEKELHLKLFVHDKKQGMLPTPAGQRIINLTQQLFELQERIYQCAREENGLISGRVRVASLSFLVGSILSPVLASFHQQYPGVELEILEGTPAEVSELLDSHQADLALSCAPFGPFEVLALHQDALCLIYPPGAQAHPLDLRAEHELVIVNRPALETLQDALGRRDLNRRNLLMVETVESAVAMVRAGLGPALTSEVTAEHVAPELERAAVKPAAKFEVGVMLHDRALLPPAAAARVQLLQSRGD